MNIIRFVSILGIFIGTGLYAQQTTNFPFKAGTIKFISNISGETPQILCFDDFGKKRFYDGGEFGLGNSVNHHVEIVNSNMVYDLDYRRKSFSSRELRDEELSEFLYPDELLVKGNFKKVGEEIVLDRMCQIYSRIDDGEETKFWIWKGFLLKSDIVYGGTPISMEVISIDETVPDESLFEIPWDFAEEE